MHVRTNLLMFPDFCLSLNFVVFLFIICCFFYTPCLFVQVVSSVKWLEDELELNALHNPGSRRGSGNEKAAAAQRAALCAALGGRVEVAAMATISGSNWPS